MIDLDHSVWTEIASFLPREDQFTLLAMNTVVVNSPLRRQFFARTTWQIPPTPRLAGRVLQQLTMKAFIQRAAIHCTWQQAYLADLPSLESVIIDVADGWDFILSPCIPPTVKRLSLDWPGGEPNVEALGVLTVLEELTLKTSQLQSGDAILRLPELKRLHVTTGWMLSSENSRGFGFISRLRHLEAFDISGDNVFEDMLPAPSRFLDTVSIWTDYLLSVSSLELLAPHIKTLRIRSGAEKQVLERDNALAVVRELQGIERLDLKGAMLGSKPQDLALVMRFTSLKQLHLSDDECVENLVPFSVLTQLEDLSVTADRDADWSPISKLQKLRVLQQSGDASHWNESFARTVASLPLLTTLLYPTKFSTAFPVPQVTKMEIWNSGDTLVLEPGCCVNVTSLKVTGPVDCVSLVQCFPNLNTLESWNGKHIFPEALCELSWLEHLDYSPSIESLSFLGRMTNLVHLNVRRLDDLSVFRGMKKLRSLKTSLSKPGDVAVLAALKELREVHLKGASVRDVACLRGHPSLSMLRLPKDTDVETLKVDGEYALPNLKKLFVGEKMVWPPL